MDHLAKVELRLAANDAVLVLHTNQDLFVR